MTTYIRGSDNFDTTQVTTGQMQAGTDTASLAMSPAKVKDAVMEVAPAIKQVVSTTISPANGTTSIPDDNTSPLISEGTQVATLNITPSSSSNKIHLTAVFSAIAVYDSSVADGVFIAALFRDSTCIGSFRSGSDDPAGEITWGGCAALDIVDSPATTSAVTYTIRVGKGAGASWRVNQSFSYNSLNSTLTSAFVAKELSV